MFGLLSGKPGTGKTYEMMRRIVDDIADWLRYEEREGEEFPRKLHTNIVINIDGLNQTLSERLGRDVDASHYIVFLDDAFFSNPEKVYWWETFPVSCLVVIDEVHKYLGRKLDYGSLDLEEALINYLSTHRHQQQDIWFLTQHPDQFAKLLLCTLDEFFEVVNIKNQYLGFPVNIPMSDFDTVKEAFGITSQYYRVNVGNMRGKAIRWQNTSINHLMKEEIFRVYKSHTLSDVKSDRPSLKMKPFEAVVWFARRHAWHLLLKLGAVGFLFAILIGLVNYKPPGLLADTSKKSDAKKTVPATETDAGSKPAADPEAPARLREAEKELEIMRRKFEDSESRRRKDAEIVALYDGGVLTVGGRVEVGQRLLVEGCEEVIESVDVRKGNVRMKSGMRLAPSRNVVPPPPASK